MANLTAPRIWSPRCLSVVLSLFAVGTAAAATKNMVTGVELAGTGESRTVRIRTAQEPTFTVFRLSSPMRVVVDVSGGDVSSLTTPIAVEDGVLGQIAAQQFSADGFFIGRLIVGFEKEVTYDVQAEGHSVVIRTGTAPGATVDRAMPPPVAPVDRAAAERYESAKADAERAAAKAGEERARAESAAQHARQQQDEAQRLAQDAERVRKQAEEARNQAETLRRKAQESIARDRAAAEEAARRAEQRLQELQASAQAVAASRAEAERLAAQAEQARRDAEETAARAEAQHKVRLAELEEQTAHAQKEKKAADQARVRAEAARREAEQAQAAADQARVAAEKTRAEMSAKLTEIGKHERDAQAAIERLVGERAKVAEEQKRVTAQQEEVEARARQVEKDERAVASRRQEIESKQKAAEERLSAREAELDEERGRLKSMQQGVEETQRRVEAERAKVADMQKRLSETRPDKGRADAATLAKIEADKKALQGLKARTEQEQDELKAERQRLKLARDKFERAQAEQVANKADLVDSASGTLVASGQATRPLPVEALVQASASKVALASSSATVMPVATTANSSTSGGSRLIGIKRRGSGTSAGVLLALEGQPTYEVLRLDDPPRLVIDLADTVRDVSRTTYGVKSPFVRRVRLGDHGSVTRAVLDLSASASQHDIQPTPEGLLVRMQAPPSTPGKTGELLASAAMAPTASPGGSPGGSAPSSDSSTLRDVHFSTRGDTADVILDIPQAAIARVDDRSRRAWVLELRGARVPKQLERSLDTTAYGTVVRLVSTYQASSEPPIVNVVANLEGPATYDLRRESGQLVWQIRGEKEKEKDQGGIGPVASLGPAASTVVRSVAPQQAKAKKRISIDLKDADIVNVVRLISEVSGENIITGDDVSGKVTLKLRNVPWDQALDTILKSKGYGVVREHDIMRIAPQEKIQREKELQLARQKAEEQVEEPVIKMVTVNYATAAELEPRLKPLLSGRGTIQVDERTNTLIVDDIKSNVSRVVELTRRLDKQTPQVLIEARIVEATSNNLTDLGVQWGGTGQANARSGNPTGLAFPGDVTVAGASDDPQNNKPFETGINNTANTNPGRFAVNLPAPIGAGAGGGLGFIFGSASGQQILNLRLSALEEQGKGRIISSPRITTLDNRTARISQGIDIPITVVSAAGANTRFIQAALELEVTPHVTNDGSVLMKIHTAKNEPDFGRTGAGGDPTIVKKLAETEVLVRDGDTTVIGGIYTRSTTERYRKVPLLADIPIIGLLFKRKTSVDDRAELLVFITPRIVNREESLVAPAAAGGVVQ